MMGEKRAPGEGNKDEMEEDPVDGSSLKSSTPDTSILDDDLVTTVPTRCTPKDVATLRHWNGKYEKVSIPQLKRNAQRS